MSQGKLIIGNQEEFNHFLSLYNKSINENYIIISGDPYIEPINALKFYDLREFDSFLAKLVHSDYGYDYDELNHVIFCIHNMPRISDYRFYHVISELINDEYDISTMIKFFYNVNELYGSRLNDTLLSNIDDVIILKDLNEYEQIMIKQGFFKDKRIIYLNKEDEYSKHKEIIDTQVRPFKLSKYQEIGINYFKKPNSKNNYKKNEDNNKMNDDFNYIVISKDKRIPEEIKKSKYKILTVNQFIDAANSDKGILINEGLYYNIDSLTKTLYDAILNCIGDLPITFYKFDDQDIKLDFSLKKLTIYSSNKIDTMIKRKDKEYTIVSKDKRIPDNINSSKINFLTQERFIKEANSEKGLEIEYDGIYFNIDSLTKELYDALLSSLNDIPIVFYKYDDQDIKLDFEVKNLKIYKSKYSIKKTT